MGGGGIGSNRQPVAEGAIREHLRQFGEQLQVVFGGSFRHQQDEYVDHRKLVRGIELHGHRQAQKGRSGFFQALDATMRNSDPLAKSRGSHFLAGKKGVIHQAAGDTVLVLEDKSRLFENTLLAAGFKANRNVFHG